MTSIGTNRRTVLSPKRLEKRSVMSSIIRWPTRRAWSMTTNSLCFYIATKGVGSLTRSSISSLSFAAWLASTLSPQPHRSLQCCCSCCHPHLSKQKQNKTKQNKQTNKQKKPGYAMRHHQKNKKQKTKKQSKSNVLFLLFFFYYYTYMYMRRGPAPTRCVKISWWCRTLPSIPESSPLSAGRKWKTSSQRSMQTSKSRRYHHHLTLIQSHYTLHTTHYTLHTTHYTLHTTHYTLHTTHYTLHTTH